MKSDKKEIAILEQINLNFINSLTNIIKPFVNKLKTIHENNVHLTENELEKLKQSINLIKIYSSKEASFAKYLNNPTEKQILKDIEYEIAIVMKIAADAEKGKFEDLYSECEELKLQLLKLEQDIVNYKKIAA